ncbi:hypothetical protein RIF29_14745 [Crotalaria pallida]|uniref:Uncharacterized protein n=1 Tax=Crotalaria pallida TaxID=3830 RepID=A0AAN9IIK5_CROPI
MQGRILGIRGKVIAKMLLYFTIRKLTKTHPVSLPSYWDPMKSNSYLLLFSISSLFFFLSFFLFCSELWSE